MRIQKRYWVGIFSLALIGLLVFVSLPPAEPLINGKPLGYWLDNLKSDTLEYSSAEFKRALPAIDERCVPWLIYELEWKPSPAWRKAEALSWKWFHLRLDAERRDRRVESCLILGWLGSRASNAIPTLEEMSRIRKGDRESVAYAYRGAAISALILIRHDSIETCARKSIDLDEPLYRDYHYAIGCLGTNAAPYVPIYLDAIHTTTNEDVKAWATLALGMIHSRPELSLPVLRPMLNETNEWSRHRAALSLGWFGPAGKPAWDDLVSHLNDSDEEMRSLTATALWRIDPAAAQKLGATPSF